MGFIKRTFIERRGGLRVFVTIQMRREGLRLQGRVGGKRIVRIMRMNGFGIEKWPRNESR